MRLISFKNQSIFSQLFIVLWFWIEKFSNDKKRSKFWNGWNVQQIKIICYNYYFKKTLFIVREIRCFIHSYGKYLCLYFLFHGLIYLYTWQDFCQFYQLNLNTFVQIMNLQKDCQIFATLLYCSYVTKHWVKSCKDHN